MAKPVKHRVVYIEDDPDMIDLARIILGEDQFEILEAADGATGLALMRETTPDLLLLDLMLPDMGGWTVYQTMKEEEALSGVPVIVITAQSTPIDRILGEHIAKVQVYLTKPFSPQELRTAVSQVLSTSLPSA